MAIYKNKRDKRDIRYLWVWFALANISNVILEFLDKNNPVIKNSVLLTSIVVIVLMLLTPLLLQLYSWPLEKKAISFAYKYKTIYQFIWITLFIACILYVLYSRAMFYFVN